MGNLSSKLAAVFMVSSLVGADGFTHTIHRDGAPVPILSFVYLQFAGFGWLRSSSISHSFTTLPF